MATRSVRFARRSFLTAAIMSWTLAASAATALVDFAFDEGAGTKVTDSINSLVGVPGNSSNPPTFVLDSPSGRPGDTAMQFAEGQYMTVEDPDTRVQFDTNNPSFTLQAWIKFDGNPAGRMVFFYSGGPGGAVSFSVNSDRTVFVTTLAIADVSSQAAIPDDGKWHHIAVVHENGLEIRFYVDGVLGDTVPYTGGVHFNRTQKLFSIGSEWNGALQFTGLVDRLKVSSGILTPDQLDSQAATPVGLVDFEFDEGSGTKVTDSINSLVGVPGNPANPPTFLAEAPSGQAGDTAIQFESGQYLTVEDPDTRVQFDKNNPSFTLQAWVKFDGYPAGRMVFFYSGGPGGAVSFSVNTDRTVFVTTLAIADVSSQAAIPDDGQWHHIAVVHENGLEIRFYVDGVLGDTVPYTGGVHFNRTQKLFSIGGEWNGALQYVGGVDRLKISSGIISAEQLDYKKVPPVGTAGLTMGRPSVSPFGFSMGVTDVGGSVADTNTIVLTFNGETVSPTAVTKSGATTTISYSVPNPPLPSGSTNTASMTIKDNKGVSYSNSATFVVATYGTLPASAALPGDYVDKSKKGFKIKTYQIEAGDQTGTIAYNEDLLAGNLGPNIANLSDAGGVDSKDYFTWPGVINLDTTPTAQNGYFNDPDYTASTFPGIPGTTDSIENFAEEIVAALEFPTSGMYTMVVNTDWTGFPNESDGFQVRAGADPLNPASSVILGFFDALAPAGPERGVANSPFLVYVPKAGIYPFRLLYFQTVGTANLEWFTSDADGVRALINDSVSPRAIAAYYQWTTPPAAPTLAIERAASGITLTFTGTLQVSDAVTGAWTDLPGASPMTITATGAAKFYRAKQ
ncbi:MAG TPA: LamG domain-containing protein [Candidatus Paceibacterota bacterium]|nr:LamG domain-containing protein [Verrucomicrobiota bacterium]HRY48974.1 LamG domain-containing protein [Candidatus Paceibacterota bacterium]HRZ99751.1 LamG domain-containing protein [Candidatus Paceibacterota bacterium]